MNWCFALVNNRLAELYFEKEKGTIKFLGHCYVKPKEYKLQKEKEWIRKDTTKVRVVYRLGNYILKD